jgi:hypothetical protein
MPKILLLCLSIILFSNHSLAIVQKKQVKNPNLSTSIFTGEASPIVISAALSFREWDSQLTDLEDNGKSLSGSSLKVDYEFTPYLSVFTKYTNLSNDTGRNAPYSVPNRPTAIHREELTSALSIKPWKKQFTPFAFLGISYFRYSSKEYTSYQQPNDLLNREDSHGALATMGIGLKIIGRYAQGELELSTDNSTHLGFRQVMTTISIGISI